MVCSTSPVYSGSTNPRTRSTPKKLHFHCSTIRVQNNWMALLSARPESLHRRQVPIGPANTPNNSPNLILVPPQGGSKSTGTSTTAIVLATVIPAALLSALGLWLIYWMYMRIHNRPVPSGGWSRELDRRGQSQSRRGARTPALAYHPSGVGTSAGLRGHYTPPVRGNTTRPSGRAVHARRHSEVLSPTTEGTRGRNVDHVQDVIRRPGRAARRRYPPTGPLHPGPLRPRPSPYTPHNRQQRPPPQVSESPDSLRDEHRPERTSHRNQMHRGASNGGFRPAPRSEPSASISPSLASTYATTERYIHSDAANT